MQENIYRITLLGRPTSTSNAYKTMCRGSWPTRYMITKAKQLKESYIQQAKEQYKLLPIKGDIEIEVTIYFDTKRKADWDNFHKVSMDSLTGIIWEDDSQIQRAHVFKDYDKANPRLEITVIPL